LLRELGLRSDRQVERERRKSEAQQATEDTMSWNCRSCDSRNEDTSSWNCPSCDSRNEDTSFRCSCGFEVSAPVVENVERAARLAKTKLMEREEFLVDRQGLGLLYRAVKLEDRCAARIASRISDAKRKGVNASESIAAIDPWHTCDGNPRNRPSRVVVDIENGLVKVFGVAGAKVTENTFAIGDIATTTVTVEPKGMVEFSSSLPGTLILGAALVGGATGVVFALVLDDLASLFRSPKVLDFLFSVRFLLVSGEEVCFELLKDGFVLQREGDFHESHFKEFVGRIADAENHCLDFLNRHFATNLRMG